MRQPMGCMLGTMMRAIKPMTIPAPSPDRMLSISMLSFNHQAMRSRPCRASATMREIAR